MYPIKKHRNSIFFLFIAIFLQTLISCNNNKSKTGDPNEIGKEIFEILKDFNTKPMEEYISATIKLKELKKIAKDTSLLKDDFSRRKINNQNEENIRIARINEYKKLKKKGIKREIDWSKIEYLDFTFDIKYKEGFKICKGKTYFKYNNKVFYAESVSIFNGDEYKLTLIENIGKKYKNYL